MDQHSHILLYSYAIDDAPPKKTIPLIFRNTLKFTCHHLSSTYIHHCRNKKIFLCANICSCTILEFQIFASLCIALEVHILAFQIYQSIHLYKHEEVMLYFLKCKEMNSIDKVTFEDQTNDSRCRCKQNHVTIINR